ncbi:RHS repeat protein, partial [Pseudoxanthomonas sacheonensis]|uniref:RHS repeat protein n=1 Tax=Pseudoxanthomonas sacheonensis TaxID=443615 RepID=UPI0013D18FB9
MGFSIRGVSVAALACAILSSELSAQTAVEYGEKSLNPYMHQQETFGPLNDGMFGESINLSTGGISFSQTDLSLPGNSALPVALTRRLVVDGNKSPTHANDIDLWKDFAFGEWELDVPYLSGTYSNTEGWTVDTATPNARCTSPTSNAQYAPKLVSLNGAYFYSFSFWAGISLYVPGQGEQSVSTRIAGTPLPQPTATPQTLLTTQSNWRFNCLPTLKSGQAGEGFVGLSPDGVKYYFDWMVSYRERPLSQMVIGSSPPGGAPPTHHLETMTRSQVRLYVSRIEDRFGNYVDYNWAGAKLTSVVANDGRQITLAYNAAGAVESATNGTQSVSYGYSNGYLSSVTQPDNSAWAFSSAAMRGINRYVPFTDANFTDFPFECQMMRKLTSEEGVLSMTHPSGAVGQFTLGFKRHYRTNIDGVSSCPFLDEGSPQEADGPQAVDNWWRHKPYTNIRFDVLAIKEKVLSGPGISPMQWAYSHADSYNVAPYGYPIQGKRTATVTNPDNTIEVSVYGTDATANEDQLLSLEVRSGQTVASHTDLTYVQTAELPSMGFPDRVGTPLVADWTGTSPSIKDANRPLKLKTVIQDGANFNYRANTFDVFARPLAVDKWSGGMTTNFGRTDVTEYYDNLGKWVLGQVRKVTNTNTNVVASQTDYDPSTATPLRQYGPGTTTLQGKLLNALTYNADGTVATVKDGNNNITTLTDWYRGVPRNIQYADSTTESAVVNGNGWITAATDENGFTTSYGYDAMGRMASIVYPTGDSTVWNTTTQN